MRSPHQAIQPTMSPLKVPCPPPLSSKARLLPRASAVFSPGRGRQRPGKEGQAGGRRARAVASPEYLTLVSASCDAGTQEPLTQQDINNPGGPGRVSLPGRTAGPHHLPLPPVAAHAPPVFTCWVSPHRGAPWKLLGADPHLHLQLPTQSLACSGHSINNCGGGGHWPGEWMA